MEVSTDRGQVCEGRDHQGQVLEEEVRATPCWAGDWMSRSRRSRGASLAICSQERPSNYCVTAANALDAAGASEDDMPAVQVAQRTSSQPGMLEPQSRARVLRDQVDLRGGLRVARRQCGFQQDGSLPSAEEC